MEINTILYNASEVMPYLCTILPVISLCILPKQDIKMGKKILIMIFEIIFLSLLFFYTKNLTEMPKVVDDVYSDAIQTLNEHELTHTLINKNEEDIDDTKYWRVTYQSVPEGNIITKRTIVSLTIDKIAEDNSKNEDNSITSNGDNTINVQNYGGTVKIDNSTTIIQSQAPVDVTQSEDTTEKQIETTIKTEDILVTTINKIEKTHEEPRVPIISPSITSQFETTTINTPTSEVSTKFNNDWSETEISETLYIKSDCYSRTKAVVGSDTVKKYTVGTMVNVIATTDTGYYKLVDGTFIHSDYITDEPPYIDIYEENYNEYSNINSNIEILVDQSYLTIPVGESVNVQIEMRGSHSATLCTSNGAVAEAHWTDIKVSDDIVYLTITGINVGDAYIKVYFDNYPDIYYLINVYVVEDNTYIEQTSTDFDNDVDSLWNDVFGY